MSALAQRIEPYFSSAIHTSDELAKKYIPEPYYTQGSDIVKTAYSKADGYRVAAEKYAHETYDTVQKTRADYEKKVAAAQEKAYSTAKASYDAYVPPPVKATVETSYTTATQAVTYVQKRVSDSRDSVLKQVDDAQKMAWEKTDEAKKLALEKAGEAQHVLRERAVEVATSAYKVAEPYIAPVQAKAMELVKMYHIDERAAEFVQQYHLDQRAAVAVTYAEKHGVPVPSVVKSYLPVPAPGNGEPPKENGGSH